LGRDRWRGLVACNPHKNGNVHGGMEISKEEEEEEEEDDNNSSALVFSLIHVASNQPFYQKTIVTL
jgi:hypothetical protein